MVFPTKETKNGNVFGGLKDHDHDFRHTEDGFDIYVDDDGYPVEEKQKVFECSCGAGYIEYTIISCKDLSEELAMEVENKFE